MAWYGQGDMVFPSHGPPATLHDEIAKSTLHDIGTKVSQWNCIPKDSLLGPVEKVPDNNDRDRVNAPGKGVIDLPLWVPARGPAAPQNCDWGGEGHTTPA